MSYAEFFNDVFGPVMHPGSSSHTAGPCRIGRRAVLDAILPLHEVIEVMDQVGRLRPPGKLI